MNSTRALPLVALCLMLPAAADAGRVSIAVMNLKSGSGVTADDAELLSDRLRIELFNTGKFSVMERGQMQEILKEQGFQQSGACTDEGCMVDMGKMLGVQQLIGGSIGKLGNLYLINLRSINVATAKIEAVVSQDISGSIENLVKVLPDIAAKLAGGPAPAPAVTVTVTVNGNSATEQKPEQSSSNDHASSSSPPQPAKCNSKAFLERSTFAAKDFGFSISDQDMDKLNGDVTDALQEQLNECLSHDVKVATKDQLAQLQGCKSVVIRFKVNAYSTKPGARGQVKGTANVSLLFFDGVDAVQPYHEEPFEETGDQHWGEFQPFKNAFEAIAKKVKDKDFSDWMRDTRARIRKL